MKRIIVDYSKLTGEILNLLVEKFPDGYDDSDIVRFKNAKNETVEAVEVRTEDTIYLVKVSTKLADRIENYDEDDELETEGEDSLDALKELEIDDADDDDDVDSDKAEDDTEDTDEDTEDSDIEDEDDDSEED
ncbi:DNA primase [Flavobacterium humi]|uniref:DNA primase n=1 Tax=Flavobacterium humi TaxID=2562683 RepID=UPI00146E695C|nr:DNA primase [Flavobacterium humi]